MKKFNLKNKSIQKGILIFIIGLLSGVLLMTSLQHFQSSPSGKDAVKEEKIAEKDTAKDKEKTKKKIKKQNRRRTLPNILHGINLPYIMEEIR